MREGLECQNEGAEAPTLANCPGVTPDKTSADPGPTRLSPSHIG